MRVGRWAFMAVTVVVTAAISALLWRMWSVRHSFEIAARSPVLAVFTGIGCVAVIDVILLHWAFLFDGKGLSCFIFFWTTYIAFYACAVIPYSLRAVRLVVVYNASYRYKYASLVKWKRLVSIWLTLAAGIITTGLIVYFSKPDEYTRTKFGCFLLNERSVVASTLALSTPAYGVLICELTKVHDAFNIRSEMIVVAIGTIVVGWAYLSMQLLVDHGILPDSSEIHLAAESIVLFVVANVIVRSIFAPLAVHGKWCGCGKSGRVVPWTGRASLCNIDTRGVLDLAREDTVVSSWFADLCKKSLCMESWDFIVEAIAYESLTDESEQFDAFGRIMDEHLRPTSPQEVNISSAMQSRLKNSHNRDSFFRLDACGKRNILEEPLHEIARMLDDNLLMKFRETPEMQRRRCLVQSMEQASTAANGDEDMLEMIQNISLAASQG